MRAGILPHSRRALVLLHQRISTRIVHAPEACKHRDMVADNICCVSEDGL